ncbi:MAG: AraC family transcriptional regulator [Clostridia bacterium]|nr:AraC family transcriptional regulator [Clostridia bacterium]
MITISSRMKPLSKETVYDYRMFHGYDDTFEYVVGMHYHEHYEFYLHLRGGTNLVVGQTTYRLEPDELYIIPPFHIHGVLAESTLKEYERAWIHITPECLSRLGGDIIAFDKRINEYVKRGKFRITLNADETSVFVGVIDRLRSENTNATAYGRMKAHISLCRFFNELCRVIERDNPAENAEKGNPLIHQVFYYITENCTENISLETLSERFNISKYYLSHTFSNVYNVSVYRYTLMCRIAMAQRLITRNDDLTAIAQQCGFSDYSNFLRAFEQITGTTPSAYRKRVHGAGPQSP